MRDAFLAPLSLGVEEPVLVLEGVPVDHVFVDRVAQVQREAVRLVLVVVVGDGDDVVQVRELGADLREPGVRRWG